MNNLFKWDWFNNSGGGSPNYGLLSDLVSQTGNDGQKSFRINRAGSSQQVTLYRGSWSAAVSNYVTRDRVTFRGVDYEALQNVPTGTEPSPFITTAYWRRLPGIEFRRDLGNGSFIYDSIVYSDDDMRRWGLTQRVTPSASSYQTILNTNLDPAPSAIGASGSTITLAAVPTTYSLTVASGLSSVLFAPIAMGSCTDSMTIIGSIVTPTFQTITLGTGLDLETGDFIKLENSSTVFNIARVIIYDTLTGSAKIGIINGVGSGTYTSWTIYKVSVVFASWNSSPDFVNFTAHIVTYDNGTGAATVRAFAQLGSGTRTTWTVWLGRQQSVLTGSSTIIHQQQNVMGQSFTGRYYGDQLVHFSIKRATGCGVRYFIAEGPNAGDEFTIDLYSSTTDLLQRTTVNPTPLALSSSSGYKFIAFFIASPSSGTNTQANIYYDYGASPINRSFDHNIEIENFTVNNPMAGGGFSSGELAIAYKKNGTADSLITFFDHNLYYQGRYTSPAVYKVDDVVIDPFTRDTFNGRWLNFNNKIELEQTFDVFHYQQVSRMAHGTISHTYDANGLSWIFNIILDQDWETGYGYIMMIVFPRAGGGEQWFNTIETDLGGTITDPGGTSDVPLSGTQINWKTALIKSTQDSYTDNQLYAMAQWRGNSYLDTWGSSGNFLGYSSGRKLYPARYGSQVLPAGTVISFEGRQFAGHVGTL